MPGRAQLVPIPSSTYARFIKPMFDHVAGAVLAVTTFPIVLAIAAAIMARMGRPAIFTQQRVGRHGRPFTLYKFRTMIPDRRSAQIPFPGPDRRRVHKSPKDPRVTPLGRFLRKWSLDELPQLWNVAMGHMSLVGPRPELVEIVESKYEPWQHQRHVVKPGVTGLWQISDQREALMYLATDVDLLYVERLSLATDIRILLLTIPAVLGHRRPVR